MNAPRSCSFELLVSYVDGQLDRKERAYVLSLLEWNPDLNREVCELRQVKDMVSFAYQRVGRQTPPPPPRHRRMPRWLLGGLLGVTLLAGAALVGGGAPPDAGAAHRVLPVGRPMADRLHGRARATLPVAVGRRSGTDAACRGRTVWRPDRAAC